MHAKYRTRLPQSQPAVVHLRRAYSETRFGQLHLWTAYPSGGGFDERTPLICLHQAGGSGRLFAPVLSELGGDRSVYAPDLPGHGSSDAAGSKAGIAELAGAVADFIDGMRLRTVDVFGYQLGALLATELAIARPQLVRRVILWGIPAYAAQERAQLLQYAPPATFREDGSDVVEEWRRLLQRRGPGVPVSALADDFSDRLRGGAAGARAFSAMLEYPASERLPLMRQPALVLRPRDKFWEHAPRARASLLNGALMELPDYGQGFLSAAPHRFAAIAREFLDR